ncbi:hypothetical protein [Erythrobacter crassostreae]|uniref:Asparagine synthetase domain-containing protein n=1 Tax=Erythrobacter crassostreae TaxID=2828328 RepID=A0A9X1F2S0_9SPHN|nr:hypothetical protein [Erythrobacter crassostrea]MBV7258273.1 hypothetical protein [Erythrobacter crassostrea]
MTAVLDPSNVLEGKYVISKSRDWPEGLKETRLTPIWSLATDDDLNIVEIQSGGQRRGWLIGVVVDLDAKSVCMNSLVLETGESLESIWEAICRRCAGSWLCILDHGHEIEVRPDASATIGAVYDPDKRRIASHAFLLTGDAYSARLKESERSVNGVDRDGWFTGGLTAHSGIMRLLPNHCLGTIDFVPVRVPQNMPDYQIDVGAILDEIASEISDTVTALASDKPTTVCLTGGNETRALLASLRCSAKSLPFMTIDYPQSIDAVLAGRLAVIANLDHSTRSRIEATEQEKQEWRIGAGHAMAGANKDYFPSVSPLAGQYLVGGLGGEVGRGFLWPTELEADDNVSTDLILARLKMPRSQSNFDVVRNWHANLPSGLDAFQVLDLAYLELRMGPWAFGQPRMRAAPRSIHPLISYTQFSRMFSISPAIRARDQMLLEITKRQWPELLDIPINKHGDWRDFWNDFVRAVSSPSRVLRKIKHVLLSKL